jgi:hypothetical protein
MHRGLGIRRSARDVRHKLGDGLVDGSADCSRRAVVILKRRRDAFEKDDSSFCSNHRVFASDLLDLAQDLLYSLDCRLRPPAEGVTPEARLELPFCALHRVRLCLWPLSTTLHVSPGS